MQHWRKVSLWTSDSGGGEVECSGVGKGVERGWDQQHPSPPILTSMLGPLPCPYLDSVWE